MAGLEADQNKTKAIEVVALAVALCGDLGFSHTAHSSDLRNTGSAVFLTRSCAPRSW